MITGIIIPFYNEEQRLNKSVLQKFVHQDHEYHLCLVNNGSKDKTIKFLKEIQSINDYKVSIVDLKRKTSKAGAVRAGVRYLENYEDMDYVGFVDAALILEQEDIRGFLDDIKVNDQLEFIFGSRTKNASDIIDKGKIQAAIVKLT